MRRPHFQQAKAPAWSGAFFERRASIDFLLRRYRIFNGSQIAGQKIPPSALIRINICSA
jgi:hypothetical protein